MEKNKEKIKKKFWVYLINRGIISKINFLFVGGFL